MLLAGRADKRDMETPTPDADKVIAAIVGKVSSSRGVPSLSTNLARVLAISGASWVLSRVVR